MNYPLCNSRPTDHSFHIPPFPWESSFSHVIQSPCDFLGNHEEHNDMPLPITHNHFIDLPESIQYKIISMMAWSSLLNRSNYAYYYIKEYIWVSFYSQYNLCWRLCVIYDILDEEFFQNLIYLIYRLGYIWRILLNTDTNPINPLVGRFVKLCGPPSLHPNE